MKRWLSLICLILTLLFLWGCGKKAEEAPTPAPTESAAQEPQVDLSRLSDTMAYAEFFYVASQPENYRGKTMRIRGEYQTLYAESIQKTMHWLVLTDQAACCSVALTLELPEGSQIQFPENGANMELVGLVDYYTVGTELYPMMTVQSVHVLSPA